MKSAPKVSISVITYKHAPFLSQTIEGILAQEADFPIQCIISDDHSPDQTEQVVGESLIGQPNRERISYVKQASNLGMSKNFAWTLEQLDGNYLAICEGDDYWTDPNKLKKQIDLLEANPDCSVSFHNVKIVDQEDQEKGLIYTEPVKSKIGLCEYLSSTVYAKTCSLLIRLTDDLRSRIKEIPLELLCDATLVPLCLEKGQYCIYSEDIMAAYRVHSGGVWSLVSEEKRLEDHLKIANFKLQRYADICDLSDILSTVKAILFKLILINLRKFQLIKSKAYMKQSKQLNVKLPWKQKARLIKRYLFS